MKLIKNYLKEIQRNDCTGYDPEKIGLEKYFIRKYFIKNGRNETYNKLMSFIDNKVTTFNKHIEDENTESKK